MESVFWHTLLCSEAENETLTGQFSIPAESSWFDGHFPGEPVLPGVSMLYMVQELIRRFSPGMKISGLRRVRFRQMVHDGAVLNVRITREKGRDSKTLSFDITEDENLVCSGYADIGGSSE